MIYEVTGDILLTKAQAIAHGVAPNDHFNQGLALSLREQWPSLAKDFRHYAQQTHPRAGEIWMWGTVGGARVFNLMTQDGTQEHGQHPEKAKLSHVNHSLKRLKHAIEQNEIKSLAIPKLATGVGGLDWKDVRPLVEEHLGDLDIPVYIYTTYKKDVQGEEV